MVDLTRKLLNNGQRVFVFENKQGTFRIKLDDILFFESFDHYYKIVTTSGNYEFKSTLMEIMKQISDSRFIQVHRSYVINYDNSNLVKYDEITMINGKKYLLVVTVAKMLETA